MIGLNVIVYTTTGQGPRGVGFAVPVNELKKRLRELKSGQPVSYPYLGVILDEFVGSMALAFGLTPGGALIDEIKEGSPAEACGLSAGEVIRSLGGESVDSPAAFVTSLWRKRPGEEVELELASAGGGARKVRVKLGEKTFGGRPSRLPSRATARKPRFWRGLRLLDSASGARVASVSPGSKAAEAGLRTGFVVDEAVASGERVEIAGPEDFERFAEGASGPAAVHVRGVGYFVIEED
jgi:S1-C subfamily serine protease